MAEIREVKGKRVTYKPGYEVGGIIHFVDAPYRVMSIQTTPRSGERTAIMVRVRRVDISIYCPDTNEYVMSEDWVIAE